MIKAIVQRRYLPGEDEASGPGWGREVTRIIQRVMQPIAFAALCTPNGTILTPLLTHCKDSYAALPE